MMTDCYTTPPLPHVERVDGGWRVGNEDDRWPPYIISDQQATPTLEREAKDNIIEASRFAAVVKARRVAEKEQAEEAKAVEEAKAALRAWMEADEARAAEIADEEELQQIMQQVRDDLAETFAVAFEALSKWVNKGE